MPEAGGVSPDTAFRVIQDQLGGIQNQLTGISQEVGETRQMATEAKMRAEEAQRGIDDLKGNLRSVTKILNGNGEPGLVRRMAAVEARQQNPGASTVSLEVVDERSSILKWKTIKDLGNKALKLLAVIVLIILGYDKMAAWMFGVPAAPTPEKTPTAIEKPAESTVSTGDSILQAN